MIKTELKGKLVGILLIALIITSVFSGAVSAGNSVASSNRESDNPVIPEGNCCSESTTRDAVTSNLNLSERIDELLDEGKLPFLFFYTDWCGYSQKQKPIIEELEKEYADSVEFIWLNVEQYREEVQEFGVSGYPTLFLICGKDDGGYLHKRLGGYTERDKLAEELDRALELRTVESSEGEESSFDVPATHSFETTPEIPESPSLLTEFAAQQSDEPTPTPPTEFEGEIDGESIKICNPKDGGYEIKIRNNLWTGWLAVFFDGIYQGRIDVASWAYFSTPHPVTRLEVLAVGDPLVDGKAWYRDLTVEDYTETDWCNYLNMLEDDIYDLNPEPGLQGVIAIPFEYYITDISTPSELFGDIHYQIIVDGETIIYSHTEFTGLSKVSHYFNAEAFVPYICSLNNQPEGTVRECHAYELFGRGILEIGLATHFFENGSHEIELRYWPKGYDQYSSDIISLDFQNEVEVANWEYLFSEWQWDELGHADLTENELFEYFAGPYEMINEVNDRLSQRGFYNITYLPSEEAGEFEFVGDREKKKDEWLPGVNLGVTVVGLVLFPPATVAEFLIGHIGTTIVFEAGEEGYLVTQPDRGLKYSEIPSGDLEGNVYVLLVRTSAKRDYVNGVVKYQLVYPFYLSQKGEWDLPTQNVIEGYSKIENLPTLSKPLEEGTEWDPNADCIEWINQPTALEKGKLVTFKLKIKDNVVPNIDNEALHLDLRFPLGVALSNAKVNGVETDIFHVRRADPDFLVYEIWPEKSVSGFAPNSEGRAIINILDFSGGAEVSFNVTLTEDKDEPVEILYGLIPGRVYTRTSAERGPTNINPITLPDKEGGTYDQNSYYYPHVLNHKFEITPLPIDLKISHVAFETELNGDVVRVHLFGIEKDECEEILSNSYKAQDYANYIIGELEGDSDSFLFKVNLWILGHILPAYLQELAEEAIENGEGLIYHCRWSKESDASLKFFETCVSFVVNAGTTILGYASVPSSYNVVIETEPVLSEPSINPEYGDSGTQFTFGVHATDDMGVSVITGQVYGPDGELVYYVPMNLKSGDQTDGYWEGIFYSKPEDSEGKYRIEFIATDTSWNSIKGAGINFYMGEFFNIRASPDKAHYSPGETATVSVVVENKIDADADIWLGVTFKDPDGNEYDLPLTYAAVYKDSTRSFTVEWTIPSTTPEGQYEIAVSCWKDLAQTDKYTDNLEWAPVFSITSAGFGIIATPEKAYYLPGELARVKIDVTNKRATDTDIWLGVTFRNSDGSEYDLPLTHATVYKDSTWSSNVDWQVPSNAPEGQYEIAVNCWKDWAQTDKYTDNLEWKPIFSITTAEFGITATLEDGHYSPREATKVRIDVTNMRGEDTDIWLGVTFRDPDGNEYDVPLTHATVFKDSTWSYTVEWTIPDNVPDGQYEIAVNCWKDWAQTDKYTDNLEWASVFSVTTAEFGITTTPEKGHYSPRETARVRIGVTNKRGEDTDIWLGVTFKYPNGNEYDLPLTLTPATAYKDSTRFFTVEWTVPSNAPEGQYKIAVNCWKDWAQTDKYTDNLEWAPVFSVSETECVQDDDCPACHECVNNKCVWKCGDGCCENGICYENGYCSPTFNEKCVSGKWMIVECGDGMCECRENSTNCPEDCTPQCPQTAFLQDDYSENEYLCQLCTEDDRANNYCKEPIPGCFYGDPSDTRHNLCQIYTDGGGGDDGGASSCAEHKLRDGHPFISCEDNVTIRCSCKDACDGNLRLYQPLKACLAGETCYKYNGCLYKYCKSCGEAACAAGRCVEVPKGGVCDEAQCLPDYAPRYDTKDRAKSRSTCHPMGSPWDTAYYTEDYMRYCDKEDTSFHYSSNYKSQNPSKISDGLWNPMLSSDEEEWLDGIKCTKKVNGDCVECITETEDMYKVRAECDSSIPSNYLLCGEEGDRICYDPDVYECCEGDDLVIKDQDNDGIQDHKCCIDKVKSKGCYMDVPNDDMYVPIYGEKYIRFDESNCGGCGLKCTREDNGACWEVGIDQQYICSYPAPQCCNGECSEPTPDLFIKKLEFSHDPIIESGDIIIAITIKRGDEFDSKNILSEDITAKFFVDGNLQHTKNFSINHNSEKNILISWEANVSAGEHELRISIDTNDTVDECNERNNNYTKTITVHKRPDLTFNDYTDALSDGSKDKLLGWDSAGDKTVNLKIPKNAKVENAMMDLSYEEETTETSRSLETWCSKRCRKAGRRVWCVAPDVVKTVDPGDGRLYNFTVYTPNCNPNYGTAEYKVTCHGGDGGTYDGCGKRFNFKCKKVSFKVSCSGFHPCHGSARYYAKCGIGANPQITYETLPTTNPSLNIDGDDIWYYEGEFSTTETVPDFSGEIQNYLENCSPDVKGYCSVPLTFHSDSGGQIKISGININYKLILKSLVNLGCYKDEQCDDNNPDTEDKCENNNICMHRYLGEGWFIADATNIKSGDVIPVSALLHNIGKTDTNQFVTALSVGDILEAYNITSLAAGESQEISFNWTAILGEHNLTITADSLPVPEGIIPEIDELNNKVSKTISVYVDIENKPPIANFTYSPVNPNEYQTVTFDASSSYDPNGDIISYEWDFGDGSNTTGTSTPIHVYGDNGVYTVTLTVTDADGGVGTDTLNVIVNNVAPTVDAGPDLTADEGSDLLFNGSFTDPGWHDTHTIEWDFGDGGNTSGTLTPTHAYGDNGVYIVTLTVTDDDGGVGTDTLNVTVNNVAPTVDAGPDLTADEGSDLLFNGSFTDPGWHDTHTIEWDFGDGGNTSGTLTPTHAYGDNGVYIVTLTVTDDDGGVGTDTLNVTVNNVAPMASVDSLDQPNLNFILPVVHTITFTGSFTDPGWLDTHTATWDFGDGTVVDGIITEEKDEPDSTGTTKAEHVYVEPETYTITLTVTDDDGGIGTDTSTVTITSAEEAIPVVNDYIQDLPDDAFKNNPNQRKNTFSEKLEEVIELIDARVYQEAIDKLQHDIRAKADGYVDGNPKNDWITDSEAQEEICTMIDDLIAYLEALL